MPIKTIFLYAGIKAQIDIDKALYLLYNIFYTILIDFFE